jgi:hypothetical protein
MQGTVVNPYKKAVKQCTTYVTDLLEALTAQNWQCKTYSIHD